MYGLADEVVARNERSIRPQPRRARRADAAQVAAVAGRLPLAGSVEIDATDLEASCHCPNAVEYQAMALIGHGQAVQSAEVGCDGEGNLLDPAQRRRFAVAQPRQRVRERSLPAVRKP